MAIVLGVVGSAKATASWMACVKMGSRASPRTLTSSRPERSWISNSATEAGSWVVEERRADGGEEVRAAARGHAHAFAQAAAPAPHERQRDRALERRAHVARGHVAFHA